MLSIAEDDPFALVRSIRFVIRRSIPQKPLFRLGLENTLCVFYPAV